MRRNGYLWTSGVNLDTAVRFPHPDFLLEWKISAIRRRFALIFAFYIWMSAIFLLPVCLTYWSRKYTTRVYPHVDNSHQVWSWYDHPLPSYSVFVCWHVPWPGDLWPLTFWLWTVTIRSLVTSYNGSHWLALEMPTRPLRMRRITWPVNRGPKTITYLESLTPICLFTIQLLLGYDDDLGSFTLERHQC